MRPLLSLTTCLFLISCRTVSFDPSNKSHSDTYEFLRFYIHNSKFAEGKNQVKVIADHDTFFDEFIVNDSSSVYLQAIQGDSIFLRQDSSFILEQAREIKSFKIEEDSLEGIRVISWENFESAMQKKSDLFWNNLYLRYKAEQVSCISKPIFSKDGNTALAIVSFFRQNGGGGAVFVYKKLANEWTFSHQLRFWDN